MNKKLSCLIIVLLTVVCSSDALAQDDLLGAMCNRAVRMWFVTGNVVDAEKACQAAILEGEKENPPGERAAYPMMKLAAMYVMMGMNEPERNDQALALFQRALVIRETVYRLSHPLVGDALNGMAAILVGKGRNDEAEACYKRVVEIYKAHHGSESLELASALSGYSMLLESSGRKTESGEMKRRATAIYEKAKHQKDLKLRSE